jgi:hypothetical protein
MILMRREQAGETTAGDVRASVKKAPEVLVRGLSPRYFCTVTVTTFDQADSPAELKARTA